MAAHRRPPPDRSPLRWTYRHIGPRHDRVDLTDAELRVVSELEHALPTSGADRASSPRRRLRERLRAASLTLAPVVRWAPCLVPLGIAVMVLFISTSVVVSFLGAALTMCGMAAVLDRAGRRLRTLTRGRPGRSPRPPG